MTAAKKKASQRPAGARVIAIANQKGGVGKSTTTVSIGAAMAEEGHPVLVIDLDPQGNASTGMGIKHEDRRTTIYEILVAEAPIEQAITPTVVKGLDAVPSTIDLAGAEIELVSQFSRELRLQKALEPVLNRYEYVLIDCPPSLGLLTINALTAARELIVPIQCEYYALEGLGQLLRNVGLVQQNINPELGLTGIVMTMFDSRTKLSEQVVEEVKKHFGSQVYDTIIPRTVRLSEAPGYGEPITMYDPRSRGAEAYRALADEVLTRPIPEHAVIEAPEDLPTVVVPPPDGREERAPEAQDEPEAVAPSPPAPKAKPKPKAEVKPKAAAKPDGSAEPAPKAEEVPPEPVAPQPSPVKPETPAAREDAEFADQAPIEGEAELPSDVLVAEATVVVEDLRQVDTISAPQETNGAAKHADEGTPKKRWRMFRKGGDA